MRAHGILQQIDLKKCCSEQAYLERKARRGLAGKDKSKHHAILISRTGQIKDLTPDVEGLGVVTEIPGNYLDFLFPDKGCSNGNPDLHQRLRGLGTSLFVLQTPTHFTQRARECP